MQKAYERLQAGAAGGQGPQAWRLLRMLQAQCILFRRYPSVLAPFKYAGYPQLLEVIRSVTQHATSGVSAEAASAGSTTDTTEAATGADGAPAAAAAGSGGHFLSGDAVEQVLAAIELCWLTCVVSRRNAEELMRTGGLPLLAGLLSRWASRCEDSVIHAVKLFILAGVAPTVVQVAAMVPASFFGTTMYIAMLATEMGANRSECCRSGVYAAGASASCLLMLPLLPH